jgi:hypothetical protein
LVPGLGKSIEGTLRGKASEEGMKTAAKDRATTVFFLSVVRHSPEADRIVISAANYIAAGDCGKCPRCRAGQTKRNGPDDWYR